MNGESGKFNCVDCGKEIPGGVITDKGMYCADCYRRIYILPYACKHEHLVLVDEHEQHGYGWTRGIYCYDCGQRIPFTTLSAPQWMDRLNQIMNGVKPGGR